MENAVNQAATYIAQQIQQGVPSDAVRQSLLSNGWNETLVNQAFQQAEQLMSNPNSYQQPALAQPSNHKTKNAVLWILSPLILLVGVAVINIIMRLIGSTSAILNVFSLLGGMAGVVLIFVGPIVGIVKLTSRK